MIRLFWLIPTILMASSVLLTSSAVALDSKEQKPLNLSDRLVQNSSNPDRFKELESHAINEINKVRTNPSAYADFLESLRSKYEGNLLTIPGEEPIMTREGVAALDEVIQVLRSTQNLPALRYSPGISKGLKELVNVVGQMGLAGTIDPDGNDSSAYIRQYGDLEDGGIEQIPIYGKNTALGVVLQILLSDGYLDRQPRQELLSANSHVIGIACGSHIDKNSLCSIVETKDFKYLSDLEQKIIEETNKLRSNPAAYAEQLAALKAYYDGNTIQLPGWVNPVMMTEGKSALEEAIADLQAAPSLPILTPAEGMAIAARDHALDLGLNDLVGHGGTDGSQPLDRMNLYGTCTGLCGENVSFSHLSEARWHVMQLVIDDGVPDRGHRKALLNPEYQITGVACTPHVSYGETCVMTYATRYEAERNFLPERFGERS
jgi:uncharacterized protein YkwD